MKKKSKNIVLIVLVALVLVAGVVATVITHNQKAELQSQLSSIQQKEEDAKQDQTSVVNTKPQETTPTIVTEKIIDPTSTTKPADTKKQMDFVTSNQWWYYFDIQNRECYAFHFKDDMNLDVAYFNNKNIDVGDSKYFTGTSTYTIDGDTIIIRYLPDALKIKNFDLTIKDNKLFFKDDKLAPHDDLSLDYPVGYFMVLDKVQ